MPELPEVETVRRSLLRHLPGRTIAKVEVRETRLRVPVDGGVLSAKCAGCTVEDLTRRGKYLLIHLGGGSSIIVHLGMSGRLYVRGAGETLEPHVHVRLFLDDGRELRFADPRRFGLFDAVATASLASDPRLAALGVEPLSRACTARHLHGRASGSRRSVKSFLMDAREVVGVGNIYASEALHAAGIDPARQAGRVSLERWETLRRAVRDVLQRAIRSGGTTLRDFRDADGASGYFQRALRVYGRDGEPCLGCGARVRRRVLSGRSTFDCPRCQR